jgi:hypothetical protein
MTHISSIGAGLFSDMAVSNTVVTSVEAAYTTKAQFDALFTTNTQFYRVRNIREFPAIGTPPNIVNVPVYGQKQSQQIQGQSDAPSMELQLNFVPADWASGTALGDYVADGLRKIFRVALLNSEPVSVLAADDWTSDTLGIGLVQNSYWYFIGKIEALLVNPQLTDANTATLTISVQSDFYGAFTV